MDLDVCSLYEFSFPNGKSYIGISKDPVQRWKDHKREAENGHEFAVYCAIRKYGWENVLKRVLVVGPREYIKSLEIAAISAFGTLSPGGYNVTLGGDLAPSLIPENAEKIRQSKLRHWEDPEYRQSRVDWATGQKMTLEQNERNRQAKLGHWQDPVYREKCVQSHIGHKDSDETRAKKGLSGRAAWLSEDRKARGREVMLGRMWITDGVEHKQLRQGEQIPDGWQRGMLKKGK